MDVMCNDSVKVKPVWPSPIMPLVQLTHKGATHCCKCSHQQLPSRHMPWLVDWPNHGLLLCCDWYSPRHPTDFYSTSRNRSRLIQLVCHLCWQLAVVTEYLFISVASTVSRRIYTHPWADQSSRLCRRPLWPYDADSNCTKSAVSVYACVDIYETAMMSDLSPSVLGTLMSWRAGSRRWRASLVCAYVDTESAVRIAMFSSSRLSTTSWLASAHINTLRW